ncbi:cell envelope biogenesis protein TonB [Bacteroidia bacterium]|nr:cell envelope biogenesis protein TonB [Bacteroidia bacterium]
MDFLIYLMKVNVAIILFYGFYRLFFRQDTFFTGKRITLLSILLVSLLYPLAQIVPEAIAEYQAIKLPVNFSYLSPEVYATSEITPAGVSLRADWPTALLAMYILAAGILLVRMLLQIGSILYQIIRTQTIEIQGIKIHNCPGLQSPFSFFSWIVLNVNQYTESECYEILSHEETHVRQLHSVDMLLSELVCIFCWFNPFVWLMKQEIRLNLEYLADRSVLQSGCEAEHYQIHLLRLSYHKAATKLTNNFNVSLLKKRIFMMNKKETSKRSVWKYALLMPVVGALVFFNGTLKTQAQTVTKQEKTENPEPVFSHVETPPRFPGGEKALLKFLQDNMVYPEVAQEQAIQGRVNVRFIVEKTGEITDVQILSGVDPSLDKEAIRLVKKMPKWTPGEQNGNVVRVYYTLPIVFKLKSQSFFEGQSSAGVIIRGDIPDDVIFEVDGKVVSKAEFDKLNPDNIESVAVIKDSPEGPRIKITTKKQK